MNLNFRKNMNEYHEKVKPCCYNITDIFVYSFENIISILL